jgi:hypothetical protein
MPKIKKCSIDEIFESSYHPYLNQKYNFRNILGRRSVASGNIPFDILEVHSLCEGKFHKMRKNDQLPCVNMCKRLRRNTGNETAL